MNLPTLEETGDTLEDLGYSLIPFLPEPYECDNCGAHCLADEQYVESQAYIMPVWDCPDCDARYYRDEPELEQQLR